MQNSELQRITNWLIDGARSSGTPAEMIADVCEHLVAAGLPLWRFGIFIRTLHPEIFGRNFIWREGQEVEIGTVDFEILDTPEFARSPLRIVFEEGLEVRGRMDDPDSKRFPFLDDMRAEGVTDYLAMPMPYLDGSIHATSWTTRHPSGFSDDDVAAIRAMMAPLARVSEIVSLRRTAEMLLDTYVGNRAVATTTPCRRPSGSLTCAASPRCRTGCRPRPWSRSSISISTARSPQSGAMAARC